MSITTIQIPTAGLISDRYEIEANDEGICIEHLLVDEDGYESIASRACLLILPEAIPAVMAALQRAARARVPT